MDFCRTATWKLVVGGVLFLAAVFGAIILLGPHGSPESLPTPDDVSKTVKAQPTPPASSTPVSRDKGHNSIPDPGEYGRVFIPYSDGDVPITPTMTDWAEIIHAAKTKDLSLMMAADKVFVKNATMVKVLDKIDFLGLPMLKVKVIEGEHGGCVGYIYSKWTYWLWCNDSKTCEDLISP